MPSSDHYVIIGNGPAGNHAASALRKKDAQGRITIISDECTPYYYKPRLTGFIIGEIDKDKLLVKPLKAYAEEGIRVRLGQKVTSIDTKKKQLLLEHREGIGYSKLIIASGSSSRLLPEMEPYRDLMKFVTCYDEVMAYKDYIMDAESFFIFGGDFVGFKFLRMLDRMGKQVSILIYPHAFWPYNLSDEMLEQVQKSLSDTNVEVIVKDDIKKITRKRGGYQIETQKGIEKTMDMVFSFNGLTPNIDFAKGSGIDTDHGILVDEYLRTNIHDIYACGSCAQIYNPTIKSYTATIGWPNAVTQGETAAMNLLGDSRAVISAGRKYFDLEGVKIKTTWWKEIDEDDAP